jgi:hypothetical protein
LGELTVVGQQQQPLGVGVETSDVEEPGVAICDEVGERGSPLRVTHRADDACRLVEHQIDQVGSRLDAHPVDLDDRVRRVDAQALLMDDSAVYLDAALVDQLLARAATAHPGRGQDTLQAYAVGVVHRFLGRGGFSGAQDLGALTLDGQCRHAAACGPLAG